MTPDKPIFIRPPSPKEQRSLRIMILLGVLSLGFFLYSLLQASNISYTPLFVLLMLTMVYYAGKFLHEWYHYYRISVPVKPESTRTFTVDVLTTYCAGEPLDMLEETLTAIANISYPHTSWCCDEADDPMVKSMCERLGIRHITRTNKKDAKAGNINHALQFATGEICVVLDPDHTPASCFLDELVPYFENPAIGFVQIIQAYHNRSESLVAKGAAQQTYQFYGPVMMTMNTYGTVQAIGANCTFRRAALDSIGGHASGLAEDMHTAMQLHAKGWESVYVPVILTRGLVPATMSSYYKQQLKWSRGTWELLLVTYPKLFSKFTWRQKLHYFTLPFHYLGGLIFLINFLIPVVSLFTGYIPLQMDLYSFVLASFPFFCMGIFIRHYVQKWVAEELDRGFHVVGGILQIGTWWVHTLGFVYTIFRKKVPYIPTPKNDKDALPIAFSIPNILIAVISLVAIVYGFTTDYTPYTLFMAFLAFLQILFMVFVFSVSGYIREGSKISILAVRVRRWDKWIVWAHGFLRRYSVPLSALTVVGFVLGFWRLQQIPSYLPPPVKGHDVFYQGVYFGQDEFSATAHNRSRYTDLAIAGLEFTWGKNEQHLPDTAAMAALWAEGIAPMLVWNYPVDPAADSVSVYAGILAGRYDAPLRSLAARLAAFNRPVYLLFASKPGALFSGAALSDSLAYRQAWHYVHDIMERNGANQIAWIWRPQSPEEAVACFPGKPYVDWLGVDLPAAANRAYSDSLYEPFHRLSLFRYTGIPVMVTRIKAPAGAGNDWWRRLGAKIDTGFTEIKSVVLQPADLGQLHSKGVENLQLFNAMPVNTAAANFSNHLPEHTLPPEIRSVVYNKGFYWFRNRHTLNARIIRADLAQMKSVGINTVERKMPGFYDKSFFRAARLNGMRVIPRFWLPAGPEDIASEKELNRKREQVLEMVRQYRNSPEIVAWNIGEDLLSILADQEYKPSLFFYRDRYIRWLAELCRSIRAIDHTRPLLMDLHWDVNGQARYDYYRRFVPEIDWFMLEADDHYLQGLSDSLSASMAWGTVQPEYWHLLSPSHRPTTIPVWQDIENTRFVTLEGVLDVQGRKKQRYEMVASNWSGKPLPGNMLPDVKILRPLAITLPGTALWYQVIYRKSADRWALFDEKEDRFQFEWYMVKTDQLGNTLFMKKIGTGPYVKVTIPEDPEHYLLFAEMVRDSSVRMVKASLNTPLE